MRELRRFLLFLSATSLVFVLAARAQDDAPSLGDAARQARLEKQQKDSQAKEVQSKDAPAKDTQDKSVQSKDASGADKNQNGVGKETLAPKTPHVITNDDLPEHIAPARTSTSGSQTPVVNYGQPDSGEGKASAESWKSQIQAQKNAVASLKSNIDSLSASIQYAPGNCVSGCVEWNERQKQKQDQVEVMKTQLEEQQKRLEEMQEAARKQGYGSSVYDP